MTRTSNRTSLSIALLAAIGFSAPAFAQSQDDQLDAWHSAEEATEAASDAISDAQVAQSAAVNADVVADHPLTGTAAEISADVAASNAAQATVAANVATGAAAVAQEAAEDAAVGDRQNSHAAERIMAEAGLRLSAEQAGYVVADPRGPDEVCEAAVLATNEAPNQTKDEENGCQPS